MPILLPYRSLYLAALVFGGAILFGGFNAALAQSDPRERPPAIRPNTPGLRAAELGIVRVRILWPDARRELRPGFSFEVGVWVKNFGGVAARATVGAVKGAKEELPRRAPAQLIQPGQVKRYTLRVQVTQAYIRGREYRRTIYIAPPGDHVASFRDANQRNNFRLLRVPMTGNVVLESRTDALGRQSSALRRVTKDPPKVSRRRTAKAPPKVSLIRVTPISGLNPFDARQVASVIAGAGKGRVALRLVSQVPGSFGLTASVRVDASGRNTLSASPGTMPAALIVTSKAPNTDYDPGAGFRLVSRSLGNPVAANATARFVVQRLSDRIFFQITARSISVGAATTITSLRGYRCGTSARNCP